MLDDFVISIPFCLTLFRSDATFDNLLSLKKIRHKHLQGEQ